MDKTEYISHEGINATSLGNFIDDPYFVGVKKEPKTYFEDGKAFERIFQDIVTGSKLFEERFFIGDDTPIPDNLAEIIKSDKPIYDYIELTKKGELNKTKENLHHWIGLVIDANPDWKNKIVKFPINESHHNQMVDSANRLLDSDVSLFDDFKPKLRDLLDDKTLFQYPIYWESLGIKKKALYDIICFFVYNDHEIVLPLDIKYMANEYSFTSFFRNTKSKYVIQSMHYTEGIWFHDPFWKYEKFNQMPFLVAEKIEPFFVGCHLMDDDSVEYCFGCYQDYVDKYVSWVNKSKPVTRVKQTKRHRIWKS